MPVTNESSFAKSIPNIWLAYTKQKEPFHRVLFPNLFYGVSCFIQKHPNAVNGKAHNIEIASIDSLDHRSAPSLNPIGASLIHRLVRCNIAMDLRRAHGGHPNTSTTKIQMFCPLRRYQT